MWSIFATISGLGKGVELWKSFLLYKIKEKQAGAELCQAQTQVDLPAEATGEGKFCIFLTILSTFHLINLTYFQKFPKISALLGKTHKC